MEFTEGKAPSNPAANQGRQIDQGLDDTINDLAQASRTLQRMVRSAQRDIHRVAADEPLATLAFVTGTGFLAGAIWKTLR